MPAFRSDFCRASFLSTTKVKYEVFIKNLGWRNLLTIVCWQDLCGKEKCEWINFPQYLPNMISIILLCQWSSWVVIEWLVTYLELWKSFILKIIFLSCSLNNSKNSMACFCQHSKLHTLSTTKLLYGNNYQLYQMTPIKAITM